MLMMFKTKSNLDREF